MHWFLTPFLGSSQKHSSGCPCFQIPLFIHKFSYSSGGLHLLASPPQAFSSNPGSPKSIRVDEGGGWMRRLAEPSCIFSKPNGCVLRVFWKPHSQVLTSWPLFLKPTCPRARGERAARNTWERNIGYCAAVVPRCLLKSRCLKYVCHQGVPYFSLQFLPFASIFSTILKPGTI